MRNIIFQQQRKKRSNTIIIPIPPSINNQAEEIIYFNAYLLPIAEKASIQTALDTYGSVRLEEGDYSGVNITLQSNQKLYGNSLINTTSIITVAAGSNNVYLENLDPQEILIQSGGVISGCTFKTIRGSIITGTNIMFENNSLINIVQTRISLDCSGSGYIRNNKIIRHQVQSNLINLVMKGNSATPSYGNVHLWTNFLTPWGNTTDIDNLKSATFVGIDAEGWNLNGAGTNPMFYAKNMGDVKITNLGGTNSYSAVRTPTFDIDADNLLVLNKGIEDFSSGSATISSKTNMLYYQGRNDDYVRNAGTVTGFDLKAHFRDDLPDNGIADNDVLYNNIIQNSLITDSILLSNTIKGTQYTPWTRPTFETLPDPLGVNWRTERIGKPDSRTYIQNLIDANGIAELPEGIFYIGSSLTLPLDDLHGLQGQGTGKTVICGLTDDFPLIKVSATRNGSWHINNLTFQGGNTGIYVEKIITGDAGQVRFMNMNYVTFIDTNYAIHLYQIQGMDNCFFNNVSFVNCNKGFFQEPIYPNIGDNYTTSYVDKIVFYKSQFINCETAFSMLATRGDNLNAWIDCKFNGGTIALDLLQQGYPIIANCDFTNYSGAKIIRSNIISIYNSIFNNNTSDAIINSITTHIEGSQFLDTIPTFSYVNNNASKTYLLNSIFNGNVIVPDNGQSFTFPSGVYSNSLLNANPTLSKLLVNVKDKIPTVLIDETPTPYPQLLVTQ